MTTAPSGSPAPKPSSTEAKSSNPKTGPEPKTGPDPKSGAAKPAPRYGKNVQIFALILTTVLVLGIAALMLLLLNTSLEHNILGTALIALGIGARLVMVFGTFPPVAELAVIKAGWAAVALGALCFEPISIAIWVAAVGLIIMALMDFIEAR